jgi:hypothetical protein
MYDFVTEALKNDKPMLLDFEKELDKIDLYDINMVLANLAIYRQHQLNEPTWKFIDWVTHRFKLIAAKEMTLEQFFNQWDKHFETIRSHAKEEDCFDRLHIVNIINSVEQLR